MARSDITSTVSIPDSSFSISASTLAPPLAAAPGAHEVAPKQQERIHDCLAFLDRIERVQVADTDLEDGVVFLLLDVHMKKTHNGQQLTEKERKTQGKAIRPSIAFRTSKAVKTLQLVHESIYDWSMKHPESANEGATAPCAYCSKFNSPAALELWTTKPPQEVHASETTGLAVVVNNSELRQYEKCINHYLQSARAIPAPDGGGGGFDALACKGYAHIPSIVASFLQRHQIKTVHMSRFGQTCGSGM